MLAQESENYYFKCMSIENEREAKQWRIYVYTECSVFIEKNFQICFFFLQMIQYESVKYEMIHKRCFQRQRNERLFKDNVQIQEFE